MSPLIRAALFVADLARATAFYRALGFTEVYYEGALEPGATNTVLRLPLTSATRCCILKQPGLSNFGMVGLFETSNPTPPPLARAAQGPSLGEVALVFYVDDLDTAITAARAAGAQEVWEEVLFRLPHRPEGQREICLRDPDGVVLNLIARDPAIAFQTVPISNLASTER